MRLRGASTARGDGVTVGSRAIDRAARSARLPSMLPLDVGVTSMAWGRAGGAVDGSGDGVGVGSRAVDRAARGAVFRTALLPLDVGVTSMASSRLAAERRR